MDVLQRLAFLIEGVRDEDYLIPFDDLKTEEQRFSRLRQTSGATAFEFHTALGEIMHSETPLSYNAGMFLKKMCVRRKRYDLLQVVIGIFNTSSVKLN